MTVCVPVPSNPETVKHVFSTCWSHDKLLQLLLLMLSHPLLWSIEDDRRLSVRGSRVFRGSSSLCDYFSVRSALFNVPAAPTFSTHPTTPLRADGKLKQKAPTEQRTAENHSFWGAHIMWFQSKHRAGNYLLTPPLKIRNQGQLRVTEKQTPPCQTESEQKNDAAMKSQKYGEPIRLPCAVFVIKTCVHTSHACTHWRHNHSQVHTRLSG